jgi:hypothetical protein
MSIHIYMSLAITEQCIEEDRHWTEKELVEFTGSLWVYSALNVTTELKNVQVCCQVHTTSLELGTTLVAL